MPYITGLQYSTITPVLLWASIETGLQPSLKYREAAVVELVDTPDSKSCERKLVTVQVRPAAPQCFKAARASSAIFL